MPIFVSTPSCRIKLKNPIAATIEGVTKGTAINARSIRILFHLYRLKHHATGKPISMVSNEEATASSKVNFNASIPPYTVLNSRIACQADHPVTYFRRVNAYTNGSVEPRVKRTTASNRTLFSEELSIVSNGGLIADHTTELNSSHLDCILPCGEPILHILFNQFLSDGVTDNGLVCMVAVTVRLG